VCISGLIEHVDGRKKGDSEENRVKKGKKVDIGHVPRGEQCPDLDRRRSGTVFSSSPVPRSRTHSLPLFHVTFSNAYSWYKEITHRIPRHNSCYQPPVGLWPRCASRPSTSSPKYNDEVGPPRGAPAEYSVKSTPPIAPVGSVKKCQESVNQLSWDPGEERRGSVTQSACEKIINTPERSIRFEI